MHRRFTWLRTGLVAANLLALSYPSLSAAQQPAVPPSTSPSPMPAPGAPQAPPPAGYQQQMPPPGYYPQQPQPGYPAYPQQPGYPQQPQPGYPQQAQPGYPQQTPPPGYYPQQPQPGYPPGYPQQAQPGYPQQPGYYPAQPGYAPAPAPPVPSEPGFRRGSLALLSVGLQIPVGDFGKIYDPGLRLGVIAGGHLASFLSLNGELNFELLNFSGKGDVTAMATDILFSPLLHFGTPRFEAFIGPRIGSFGVYVMPKGVDTIYYYGVAYGLNAGAGIPLGNMVVGAMFSYLGRSPSQVCTDKCRGYKDDAFHSVAVSGLVLF